jgi:hypothetical protein
VTGLLSCGGAALFSALPLILAIVAIVDIVRTGADWYWILIVLFFPVLGSIAYFAVVRGPWRSGGRAAALSPATARRLQAQRRLREIAVQLAHWRGPALLVEAGEQLLVLGKYAQAEAHLREAADGGAGAEDYGLPLAQALEMQGRFAEAAAILEPLCRAAPDAHFGELQLAYARALDESGRGEEAERELRDLLERRGLLEARVRLARRLLRRGESDAARQALAEARAEAAQLAPYLRRRHRRWVRAARRLRSGQDRLPPPQIEGAVPPGRRRALVLIALAAAALLFVLLALWLAARPGPPAARSPRGPLAQTGGGAHGASLRPAPPALGGERRLG